MPASRKPAKPAPAPLEQFTVKFDDLFISSSQRQGFRDVLFGLLRSRERAKTLTALADVEPGREGSHHRLTQRLHRFVSESPWDPEQINNRRIELLTADPTTAPHAAGALLLDDSGDRKKGNKTAHVARQYLGSVGKTDNGIVAVSTAWADQRVYYPLHVVPYEPASRLPKGRDDPDFATKAELALRLINAARDLAIVFRAVVADAFYGPSESPGLVKALTEAQVPFVLAFKPNQPIAAEDGPTITAAQAARRQAFESPEHPGQWTPVTRTFRDGHGETWWATDVPVGPYRIHGPLRLVVITTDPVTLPKLNTWYLVTNLAHPDLPAAADSPFPPANYTELAMLYGLRNWIEQDYRQANQELGWADFQVRSDAAIRRHWTLVNCAFTLGWLDHGPPANPNDSPTDLPDPGETVEPDDFADEPDSDAPDNRPQINNPPRPTYTWPEGLRRLRACLMPFHELQRIWRAWTNAPMPEALVEIINAVMSGKRLYLYTPP